MSNTTQTPNNNEVPRLQLDNPTIIAYIVVMTVILAVGFVGNVLTIAVLRCREHRNKSISPLMINLAVADIIIIVFGYPVVVAANLSSGLLIRSTCVWSGFINGAVGIAAISNMTMMSLVMYSSFQSLNCTTKIPRKKMAAMIAFTWLYGIMAMFPPLVGWNEFVPSASGISCCPNWVPETKAGVAYNALLVFVGFVLPLSVVIFCYYRIYKYVILAVAPYFAREKHGKSRFSVSLCSSTPRKRLPPGYWGRGKERGAQGSGRTRIGKKQGIFSLGRRGEVGLSTSAMTRRF